MNNWSISIHIFFLWFQIYICSEFENEHFTGRRSSNNLIKTKSGKTFLQRSSKGKKYNTEIQKYNRQIKYHAQETESGFDEYSQVNIIGWVIRENNLEGALSVENVPKDNSTHISVQFKVRCLFCPSSSRKALLKIQTTYQVASTYQVRAFDRLFSVTRRSRSDDSHFTESHNHSTLTLTLLM